MFHVDEVRVRNRTNGPCRSPEDNQAALFTATNLRAASELDRNDRVINQEFHGKTVLKRPILDIAQQHFDGDLTTGLTASLP